MSTPSPRVRPPAVAGLFYPDDPDDLRRLVRACFDQAAPETVDGADPKTTAPGPEPGAAAESTGSAGHGGPRALVVPHAGLVYSGPIAASAYRLLIPHADAVRRVVLLGPSHRVAFRGVAATSADRWATPLGPIAIDTELVHRVVEAGLAVVADVAHAREHSLEVQLPFLRTVVPDALLAPFVVGDAPPDEVAALLDAVWDEPGTVVVISTDLSHYHRYDEAVRLDRRTAGEILARHPAGVTDTGACGNRPLRGLLRAADDRHLRVDLLDLRNSGDTAGDRNRVVGYGAFALS